MWHLRDLVSGKSQAPCSAGRKLKDRVATRVGGSTCCQEVIFRFTLIHPPTREELSSIALGQKIVKLPFVCKSKCVCVRVCGWMCVWCIRTYVALYGESVLQSALLQRE